jgi:predicted nucleotide-binding protein
VDLYREATLRPRVRDERGVVGDGDGADDGQSEAVVVVDAILELGFFIGALGRRYVCALKAEEVEEPSDIRGVEYVPIDPAGGWKLRLAREVKAAGFDIDMNQAI